MKINYPANLSNKQVTDDNFISNLSKFLTDVASALSGGISITDNCDIRILSITFSIANNELAITHSLNRIPAGYILVSTKAPTQIYDGVSANDKQSLYLRSTVATTVNVLVF